MTEFWAPLFFEGSKYFYSDTQNSHLQKYNLAKDKDWVVVDVVSQFFLAALAEA
jgi:hypothetical protein